MNWMIFWTAFFCGTLNFLPYRVLAYYPFRQQLRFPVWGVVTLIGGTQLMQSAVYGYQVANGLSVRGTEFVFAVVCFAVYFICIRADRWKLLFLYIFFFDYGVITRGVAYFVESRLFYSPALSFDTPRSALLTFAVFAVTVPLMLWFLRRTKNRVFQTDAPMLWRTIWLLPAFTTAIVMMFTGDLAPENVRELRFLFSRVLLILAMFVAYYVLLKSLNVIREQAVLEEQMAQQQTMLALQRTQYKQLARHMQETRHARHDLDQHLKMIQRYLETGSQQALQAYVRRYAQSLPPDVQRTFCKNYVVNTIVSYYEEEARRENIDFSVKLQFSEVLGINEAEFCTILGNLLENALAACREVSKRAPFIRIRGQEESRRILLAVDNTCEQAPVLDGERFHSTKHDGYGLGTASVKTIAARYHGRADFTYQDHVFYASVLLQTDLSNNAS